MDTFEKLEQEAFDEGVKIYHFDLGNDNSEELLKGLYIDKNIALDVSLNCNNEKACILAEELGHYYTSFGNIIDLTDTANRKQEYRARLWAYDKQIGLVGIIRSYENHCRNFHEMAEYLDVTENFLNEALECYRSKYGSYKRIDNYLICFDPYFYVAELK